MQDTVNIRPTGVVIPKDQLSPGTGPPRTLIGFGEAQTFAVNWVDDNGKQHAELMHRIGGVWHRAPNGENYFATLRRFGSDTWLSQLLEEQVKKLAPVTASSLPKDDAVDPMGDE
jgi:hypothetical protein